MSDSKHPTGPMVIGEPADTNRWYDLRSKPKLRQVLLILLPFMIIVSGGLLLYRFVITPPLTENEQQAVENSVRSAKGFDQESRAYSFTQLNSAIKFAFDKKCGEAQAVYADVETHPNGVPAADMKNTKARIDELCSAK